MTSCCRCAGGGLPTPAGHLWVSMLQLGMHAAMAGVPGELLPSPTLPREDEELLALEGAGSRQRS